MAAGLDCRLCPRLADFRDDLQQRYPTYHNRPVNALGDEDAGLLIVGLAPGLHGANRSGKPFTGDDSGKMLFDILGKYGFASGDGKRLINCRITNAVKCVPPQNRPIASEVNTCNRFLSHEIEAFGSLKVILALGKVAHEAVTLALGQGKSSFRFSHDAEHDLPGMLKLVDSYHCSRYMINTKRLDSDMFERVFERVRRLLR